MNIFEYGSGYSTLFFAKYCNNVISSEAREKWRDLTTNLASENGLENININLVPKHEFVQSISSHDRKFDIIIVDSEFRNDCITISTDFITEDGIIILDNSERSELYKSLDYMKSKGFKNIEFMGIKPNSDMPSRTTIFYRENNIFNI
jgi:predicted O-methyltransferase YrrM